MHSLKRWSKRSLFALALIGFLLSMASGSAQQVGAPAPAWALPDVNGRTVHSSSFAGKVVLLNFFRSWCYPCVVEMPELVALQNQYGPMGFAVVGISVYEEPSAIRDFIATNRINFPTCLASFSNPASATVLSQYNVISVPRTVIIDRNNVVVGAYFNYHNREYFGNIIRPLLEAGPPRLGFRRSGRSILVSWPTNAANFVLESSPSSAPSATWSTVTNAFTVSNGLYQVMVDVRVGSRFFRLRKS
jgi:peroxiredoxin